jgi:O-6-methylguanine DNA methyltransferase
MRRQGTKDFVALATPTPDGIFIAHYSIKGLAGLTFPIGGRSVGPRAQCVSPSAVPLTIRRWHRVTTAAVKRALAGRPARILPPLDLARGTAFQQRVWSALQKIPLGETRSYGEIAQTIRNPRGVRAVGGACGANPIPVLVPCHRVLAAQHRLGGFSSGLKWKRLLLWREEAREWWPEQTMKKAE